MTKPKILRHGSPKDIEGALKPHRARDLASGHPDNNRCAVYASDNSEAAIFRAIKKTIKSDKVTWEDIERIQNIYLYYLPSETFTQSLFDPSQYYSLEEVMPISKGLIEVKYHLHLLESFVK
jgi:hypothetical protein